MKYLNELKKILTTRQLLSFRKIVVILKKIVCVIRATSSVLEKKKCH